MTPSDLPVERPEGLSEIEAVVWDLAHHAALPGRHAARGAIYHAQRAVSIRDVDPTMAVFRLLTGEEEAARAVMHAFHRRRYPNASELKWRSHLQKFAMVPYIAALQERVRQLDGSVWKVRVSPRDGVEIYFQVEGHTPPGKWAVPTPPLEMRVRDPGSGELLDLSDEVSRLLAKDGIHSFLDHVKKRAELRTAILYATDEGVPRIESLDDEAIDQFRANIFTMLTVFLLVDPYPVQTVAQQALDGFLRLMDCLPKHVDFGDDPSCQVNPPR